MSRENYNAASGGVSFAELLTLVFIVLKLLDVIDWSWWWVLSPLWITFGLVIAILGVAFGVALIKTAIDEKQEKVNHNKP